MEILITRGIEAWLLPPGGFLLLAALGAVLLRRRKVLGRVLISLSMIGLYALSLPLTTQWLMRSLETYPALTANDLQAPRAQAIVILGAGRYAAAPEYGGDTVSALSLERLRYGARLHRLTGLPIIVSAGDPFERGVIPEAVLMKKTLTEDFQIADVETEEQSRSTAENALYTKALLDEHGIEIYLVTHAWHMPRAMHSFARAGIKTIPAPTGFASMPAQDTPEVLRWLPNAHALSKSALALREMAGMGWYRVRY